MAELTRFQISRRADSRGLAQGDRVYAYPSEGPKTELIQNIIDVLDGDDDDYDLRNLGIAFIDSDEFIDPAALKTEDAVVREIQALDIWLTSHPSATFDDLRARVYKAALRSEIESPDLEHPGRELTSSDEWTTFRKHLADSLVAALISGATWPPITEGGKPYIWVAETLQTLTRWVLVCALVEELEKCTDSESSIRDLMKRVTILPSPPFPFPFRSKLARLPAFSDLYVVKDEWARFVAGEVAYIENVLEGELKEHSRKVVDETRTTDTRTETETIIAETEVRTTDRSMLKDETQTDTNITVGVEGQVHTSGQYGPTHVETQLAGSVQYSRAESVHRALEVSHETVDRAISRTERMVSQSRARSMLQRTVDRDRHLLDNSKDPDGNVVGMFRWVDKMQTLQIFRFPKRYLIEFEIPEPATFVRWLAANKPKPSGNLVEPDELTDSGKKDGKKLTVADMKPDDVPKYAARYGVTGLPDLPSAQLSVSEAWVVEAGERKESLDNYAAVPFAPFGAKDKEIAIPDGYEAIAAVAAVSAAPQLASWKDWTDWDSTSPGEDGVTEKVGWHEIVATLDVGGRTARASTVDGNAKPENTVNQVPGVYHKFWLNEEFKWIDDKGKEQRQLAFDTRPTSKISVSSAVGGTYKASISVSLLCQPTAATWSSWRNEVFARISSAHDDLLARWRTEQANLDDEPLVPIPAGSTARHAEVIREELKRQVIEMLLGEEFNGVNALTAVADSWPRNDLDIAEATAPYIQFLEQAFEWSNLTYILYPYYWAAGDRWRELEPIESADAEFDRFLRSGSARVVVSARPGFEWAVNFFMTFGLPWGGGTPPTPGSPLYVSVAQEIKDLTQAPADGIPEETWEARVPTTLLWLDPDPSMPKKNMEATLPKVLP